MYPNWTLSVARVDIFFNDMAETVHTQKNRKSGPWKSVHETQRSVVGVLVRVFRSPKKLRFGNTQKMEDHATNIAGPTYPLTPIKILNERNSFISCWLGIWGKFQGYIESSWEGGLHIFSHQQTEQQTLPTDTITTSE